MFLDSYTLNQEKHNFNQLIFLGAPGLLSLTHSFEILWPLGELDEIDVLFLLKKDVIYRNDNIL